MLNIPRLHMAQSQQHGNALWFILIAVALLGGLTIVISRGGSAVDQTGDVEQQRIKISQISRYTGGIRAAIQQLQLNGCSENDISFDNTIQAGYTNANSPADNSCHVFDTAGAGLVWQDFTDETFTNGMDLLFTGHVLVTGLEDDSRAELNAFIPVSSSLCQHINKDLGISTNTADITSDIDSYILYAGSYSNTHSLGGAQASGLNAQVQGCIIDDNGDYAYFMTLIAR